MTVKQFFFNPITIIIGILILAGIISIGYNKHGWFGRYKNISDKNKKSARGMRGVCVCGGEPSWLFGCYFSCLEETRKENKLIDDCVQNLINQDPEGDFIVEGLRDMCERQIRGGTSYSWQTGQGEEPEWSKQMHTCSCDGKERNTLFGCLRCLWS